MKPSFDQLSIPILQGGMGIGISLSKLAGAIAFEGGMGTLSSAYIGVNEKDFDKNRRKISLEAIGKEIKKARALSQGKGLLAINIMYAITDYEAHVKESLKHGIDAIVSGAGLPLKLPSLVENQSVLLIPIISSARVAKIIIDYWNKKYNRLPDAFILEGKKAGGHLGYSSQELQEGNLNDLYDSFLSVKAFLKDYLPTTKDIPIFVAGGISSAKETKMFLEAGARGIQLGTPFALSCESDASERYKDILLEKKYPPKLIESPAGLMARALDTPFLKKFTSPTHCVGCLKTCKGPNASYCLSEALIQAVRGNFQDGLFFVGAEIEKMTKKMSVKEIIRSFLEDSV